MSLQFGSAVAATLFPRAGALGVVALRLLFSALIMLAVCRPRLRGHSRTDWTAVIGLGVALGTMNTLFYQAIDRIPLGAAVTLELLGPLVLSVVGSRRLLSLLWAALALAGVYLLGSSGFDRLDLAGAAFALAAGAMWVAYIIFNSRTGARFPKADGLALAMGIAALLSAPLGGGQRGTRPAGSRDARAGRGGGRAVLRTAVHAGALRTAPDARGHVRAADEPDARGGDDGRVPGARTATHQALELVAIALVVVASMGAVRTSPTRTGELRLGR